MTQPIALQLYSVREAMAGDFTGTVEAVAAMGYAGVEPIFQLPNTTVAGAAQLFKDLGLAVPSAHVPLPLGDMRQPVLDFMAAMGSTRVVSGKGPDDFTTLDRIKATCELFNEAQAVAADQGLAFGLHNHWWEFEKVEGRYVYQWMVELLAPAIFFEIDAYWVQAAGCDPAQIIADLGARVQLLHVKDGSAIKSDPMVAVGEGVLDYHAIVKSAAAAKWLIVELDRCATDMLTAVDNSLKYLVTKGLGHGK